MNSFRRTIALALSCSLFLAPLLRAIEPGFVALLDRNHTKGWVQCGPGRTGLKDGEATTMSPKGNGVYWYAERSFSDFVLRLEFKGAQREFNSGVFIRFPNPHNDPAIAKDQGNEVQICDGLNGDQPTGSIYNFQNSSAVMQRADWNEYEIAASGNRVLVKLNGRVVNDFSGLRQPAGYIGLQCHPHGPVQFRNVRIQELSGAASPLASAPAAIQSNPNQPRIETLSQQAPNAEEWVVTPLDESVPGGIRQNLVGLREDLADEGKKKPKSAVEAYSLGYQLCNTMIAALDERARALANAGYTARQADANTGVTSPALEANRNYMMSWPQYRREQAQRGELLRQKLNGADVIKEGSKLEWSKRASQIRGNIDVLYGKLREAMRQPAMAK